MSTISVSSPDLLDALRDNTRLSLELLGDRMTAALNDPVSLEEVGAEVQRAIAAYSALVIDADAYPCDAVDLAAGYAILDARERIDGDSLVGEAAEPWLDQIRACEELQSSARERLAASTGSEMVTLEREWVPILVKCVTARIRNKGEEIDGELSCDYDDSSGDSRALEYLGVLLAQRNELMAALKGTPVTAAVVAAVGPEAVERELERVQGCSHVGEVARRARMLAELDEFVQSTASRELVTA